MKKNMGKSDRVIRTITVVVIAGLYFAGLVTGTVETVLLVVAAIFALTSIAGVCPLYRLFGIHSGPARRRNILD